MFHISFRIGQHMMHIGKCYLFILSHYMKLILDILTFI